MYFEAGRQDGEKFDAVPELPGDLLMCALDRCMTFFDHEHKYPQDIVTAVDEYIRGYIEAVRERTTNALIDYTTNI